MLNKINFNKSIKEKEKKILEYYFNKKSNLGAKGNVKVNELPKLRKRTKKQIIKTHSIQEHQNIEHSENIKLTKTAKLPIPEQIKQQIVEMD